MTQEFNSDIIPLPMQIYCELCDPAITLPLWSDLLKSGDRHMPAVINGNI